MRNSLKWSELIRLARSEFRDLIGAEGEPGIARVRHWPLGLPQYEIGHQGLAEVLQTTDKRHEGLFLTGNYLAGPSVANCLHLAQETALAVHGYLEGRNEIQFRQSAYR